MDYREKVSDELADLVEASEGVAFLLDALGRREDMQSGEAEAFALMHDRIMDAVAAFKASIDKDTEE